jgi:cell division protein FtsI (penicillin-binding protein 3)
MRDLRRAAEPPRHRRWLKFRVRLLGALFFAALGIISGRAFQLQVLEKGKLESMARDQYVRNIEVPARRGDIFDRRGTPLAQSVEVDSVALDPSLIKEELPQVANALAKVLKLDPRELQERLARGRRFAWVKRQVRPEELAQLAALNIPGLRTLKEPRRFYPQRELGAHVIGVAGTEGKGLEGLELAFDDELTGQAAKLASLRDARGRKLLTQAPADAADRQGASVVLTLDRHLQYVAEKALGRAVVDAQAKAGMVVVLDPATGELLALANYPSFNPNAVEAVTRDQMRNRAALDIFEPGSTFKAFVVAAALDEGLITPEQHFDCENGAWDVGRHTINDSHRYGLLTPARILQVSSNICTAKIGQLLGRERLVRYYGAFGFGQRAGLGLPGEGRGRVPFPKAEVELVTQSFGQGVSATAIQLASAYGALANGGVLMRPWLISKVVDPDGLVLLENRPTPVRQVVSAKAARQVVQMLELVVEKEGTAHRARMDEYRVSGKTGTAQKPDPVARGYSDKRIASFIGVVPAEAPRAVILVVIDEPTTNVYGGVVAAPAFKEIAVAAMTHLGVAPSRQGALVSRAGAKPEGGRQPRRVEEPERPELAEAVTERPAPGEVRVPQLAGKAGRAAIATLLAVALEPRIEGTGRVVSQTPAAGSLVAKGTKITLELQPRP